MSGCLFFDIDGTLVDSEHGEIMPSSSCLEAIHKAQKNGYRCLISSGRNLGGLKEYRNLGFDISFLMVLEFFWKVKIQS